MYEESDICLNFPRRSLLTYTLTQLFAKQPPVFYFKDTEFRSSRPLGMVNSVWDEVWAIVLQCWHENCDDRPSADEIVSKLDEISGQWHEPAEEINC